MGSTIKPKQSNTVIQLNLFAKEFFMKSLLVVLLGAISIGVAIPAAAGPDFQQIEKGRKEKRANMEKESADKGRPSGMDRQMDQKMNDMMKECMATMKES
jgi:hypothetical protein